MKSTTTMHVTLPEITFDKNTLFAPALELTRIASSKARKLCFLRAN